MTKAGANGAAHDPRVVMDLSDGRSEQERADAEREQAEDTVVRLTTKRDKAAGHLADAEQALADAEAELKGEH